MNHKLFFVRFLLTIGMLLSFWGKASLASASTQTQATEIGAKASPIVALYDPGSPSYTDIWVDPASVNATQDGTSPATAFHTLTQAWNAIPTTNPLTQAIRINLQPGTYTAAMMPNYWDLHGYGTVTAPIMIRGNGTTRNQVVLKNTVNMYDAHYVYFENLSISLNGDTFHCELCDHLLLRNMIFNGGAQQAQETIKINQSQYVYLENNDISGAWDNAIDFVAVQYGHIVKNQIHNAGDWCAYAKGGSAYLRVEANVIYNCGTGGFTAGQGTGFQFMSPPWIQYEAYDIKVVNNIIHDTDGAGLGVNGGYNILMAYNTLYRVGNRDHVIEVVFGLRSCDGDPLHPDTMRARCQQYLDQGGWGTTILDDGTNEINIPNKNVFIYNNIVYNPAGYQSQWQHFAIHDPYLTNPSGSHVPNPAVTDDNLQIRGNVIWNGGVSMPLGIEGTLACQNSNPTCNQAQLINDNAINTVQPQFVNSASGNFHPTGAWITSVATAIPDFPTWTIAVPAGNISNTVPTDFEDATRISLNPPGAYFTTISLTTVNFYSTGAHDGWILESGENTNAGGTLNAATTTFNLGDAAADKQYRAILSFNTDTLDDAAIITSTTLKIKRPISGYLVGNNNPFSWGLGLKADVCKNFFSSALGLQLGDFNFNNTANCKLLAGTFVNAPVANWYSANILNTAFAKINKVGWTQFRLRFVKDDNNDNLADYLKFFSGEAGVNAPQLIIQYYVP